MKALDPMRPGSWVPMPPERQLTAKPRPSRVAADVEHHRPQQAEWRLMAELLMTAARDLTDHRAGAAVAQRRQAAQAWLAGAAAPMTFNAVCEALDLNADRVRAELLDDSRAESRALLLFEIGRAGTAV